MVRQLEPVVVLAPPELLAEARGERATNSRLALTETSAMFGPAEAPLWAMFAPAEAPLWAMFGPAEAPLWAMFGPAEALLSAALTLFFPSRLTWTFAKSLLKEARGERATNSCFVKKAERSASFAPEEAMFAPEEAMLDAAEAMFAPEEAMFAPEEAMLDAAEATFAPEEAMLDAAEALFFPSTLTCAFAISLLKSLLPFKIFFLKSIPCRPSANRLSLPLINSLISTCSLADRKLACAYAGFAATKKQNDTINKIRKRCARKSPYCLISFSLTTF